MTLQPLDVHTNVVPTAYRGVSVCRVGAPMDEAQLRLHFLGREAYRRTRFLVVRDEVGGTALLRVAKESDQPLFSPIVEIELLAGPAECPQRPLCQQGLEQTYKINFGSFLSMGSDAGGPITKKTLTDGKATIGLVFSSDSSLSSQ